MLNFSKYYSRFVNVNGVCRQFYIALLCATGGSIMQRYVTLLWGVGGVRRAAALCDPENSGLTMCCVCDGS